MGYPLKEFLVLGDTVADRLGTLTGEYELSDESESSASFGFNEWRVDIRKGILKYKIKHINPIFYISKLQVVYIEYIVVCDLKSVEYG